jgi:hypothetical protein
LRPPLPPIIVYHASGIEEANYLSKKMNADRKSDRIDAR